MEANNVGPDQMPNYVACDLDLYCLSMTFYRIPGRNELNNIYHVNSHASRHA